MGTNGSSSVTPHSHTQPAHSTAQPIPTQPQSHRNSTTPEPDLTHEIQQADTPANSVNGLRAPQSSSDVGLQSSELNSSGSASPSLPSGVNTTKATESSTTTTTKVSCPLTGTLTDSSLVTVDTPNVAPSSTKSEPRCIGVNTVLEDLCKATITEPDLLGPCEPGTTICLNGIVWLETTTGVLVVNVTWRGRTYIGTLLDATQHDFAPPCPRDYVSPIKSSVRSSSRAKRRPATANSNFKHGTTPYSSTVPFVNGSAHNNTDIRTSTSGSHRQRLRGRNTNSPASHVKGIATEVSDGNPISRSSNAEPTLDSAPACNASENSAPSCLPTKLDTEEIDEHSGQSIPPGSDEDCCTPVTSVVKAKANNSSSDDHLFVAEVRDNASRDSCNADAAGCLVDGVLSKELDHSPPPPRLISSSDLVSQPTGSISSTINVNQLDPNHSDSNEDEVDDDIITSYPITCPLVGCKKRFTHMTALRFHLNNTPHTGPKRHTGVETQLSTNTVKSKANDLLSNEPTASTSSSQPFTSVPSSPSPRTINLSVTPTQSRAVVPPIPGPHLSDSRRPTSEESDGLLPSEMHQMGPYESIQKSDPIHTFLLGGGDVYRSGGGGGCSASFCRSAGTVGTITHEQSSSGPNTRTVTAHTVSIPHGPLSDKVETTQSSRVSSSTNNSPGHQSHSHQTKRNNSNNRSTESGKLPRTTSFGNASRVANLTSSLGSSCYKPNELDQHQHQLNTSRHFHSRSGHKDLAECASQLTSSGGGTLRSFDISHTGPSVPVGSVPHLGSNLTMFPPSSSFAGPLPNTTRVDPSNSSLFTVPTDLWSFHPSNNAGESRVVNSYLSEKDSTQTDSSSTRYPLGPGLWMNGMPFQPGMNPLSPNSISSGYPSGHQYGNTNLANNTTQTVTSPSTSDTLGGVPGPVLAENNTVSSMLDSSVAGALGLPDFLMAAAAMSSALGSTHSMNNPAVMEMLRSYMNQSCFGKSPMHPDQIPQSIIPPNGSQTHSTNKTPSGPSLSHPSVSQSPQLSQGDPNSASSLSTPASLASMMMATSATVSGLSNPTLLPPSVMHAAIGLSQNQIPTPLTLSQSATLSASSGDMNRMDPFRQLELELTTMRIASGSNVASREVRLMHQADKDDVTPSLSRFKFAPDITLKPDSMKPFCEVAVQSEMEYRQGSAAGQVPGFQTLDGSAATSRSPVAIRGTDGFGNTLINLPKRDLVTFEGDPVRYWLFMRCFEANVLKSTADPTIRLSYLVQYCSGEAKRAIESCLILNPEEGFNEALNILRKRFGRPHMIARMHIDALTDGPAIRSNGFATLSRLAGELRTCYTTLKQLN
ncbi:unnamed protein product [Echinostoma caproni]|uniref:C2H2-type domain-containing protein n=1 Tax=Echinostoma caproni TaxID=27848 RepID=A0A183AAM7_9TREM|nr:unnamed protein product [Echinostoma caproni]